MEANKEKGMGIDSEKKIKMKCDNCSNGKDFELIDENIFVCKDCGAQKEVLVHSVSYKDIDRINITSKYSYDRKVHFQDCINQYQGKQNCTIDQKVYDLLEDQFQRHGLITTGSGNDLDRKIKFSKITKEHIAMFLRELGLTKHYENVNLIHYNFTGIKPDDISHLEDQLSLDFDDLIKVYDKKFKHKINRSNFINTQYVLYQLLRRHSHPCRKEDFVLLKTTDRQAFHDEVTSSCFEELGWNMSPVF